MKKFRIVKIVIGLLMVVSLVNIPRFDGVFANDQDNTGEETTDNQSSDGSQESQEEIKNEEETQSEEATKSKEAQKAVTNTPRAKGAKAADPNGVYVSNDGNDAAGDGSFDKPFKTLSKAYTTVATGNSIYILDDLEITTANFNDEKNVTLTSARSNDGTPITNVNDAHTIKISAANNAISMTKGSLTTKNIKFTSTIPSMGRIIYVSNAAAVININEGTNFYDLNSDTYRGTAIYTVGKLNINGNASNPVSFENVTSGKDYGVISLYGSNASCVMNSVGDKGIVFDSCSTTSGGVIRMNSNSTLTINGDSASKSSVYFNKCSSTSAQGGAISGAENTIINIDYVTFNECYSGGNGGAVAYSGVKMLTIKNCVFTGNSAGNRGGAVSSGIATIDNCTFENNTAQNGGGVSLSACTLTNSTFTNNTANSSGGGAYFILNGGKTADVSDCTFDQNKATKSGGGINSSYDAANDSGILNLTDCKVTNNNCTLSSGRGGGIYVSTISNIKGCQITTNTSAGNGGGVYAYQGYYHRETDITITDSNNKSTVISNNSAASGGGIFEMFISGNNNDCSLNIEGKTSITNNNSSSNGGGIATQSSVTNTTIKVNIKDGVRIMGNSTNVGNGGGIYQNVNTDINMSGDAIISGNSCGTDKLGGGVYNVNTLTQGKFTIKDNVQIVNNVTNHNNSVKNNYVILNEDALSKDNESTHYGIYVAGALGDNAAIHINTVHSEKGVLVATALDEGVYAISDNDQQKFYSDRLSNGEVGAFPIHFDTTSITGNVNNLILFGTTYSVEHYYGIASMDKRTSSTDPDITTTHTGNALSKAEYVAKNKYGYTLSQITYQDDDESNETATTSEITVPSQDGLVIRLYYEKNTYDVTFASSDEEYIEVEHGDSQEVDYGEYAKTGTTYKMVHTGQEFFTGWLYEMEVNGKTVTGVTMDYTSIAIMGDTKFTATYASVPFLSINAPVGGFVSIQKGTSEKYIEDGTHLDKFEFEKSDLGPYIGTGAFRAEKNYHVVSITVVFPNADGTSDSYDLDINNPSLQNLGAAGEDGNAQLNINDSKTYGTINILANSSAMIIIQYEEDPTYKVTYIANYSNADNTEVEVKEGLHTGDAIGSPPSTSLYLPGYRLVGWSNTRINGADSSYVNTYDDNTKVATTDLVYYAIWESVGQYEYDMLVYLEDENGNFVESSEYSTIRSVASADSWVYFNYDDNGSIKNERDIIGYTYDKNNPLNISSFYFDSSDPDLAYQHVSLKSYFKLNRYDVTYKLNNGDPDVVQSQKIFNSKLTPPSNPTRTGYTFMGFYEDENFVHKVDFDNYLVPEYDVTFYAKWRPNNYTLTFEYNGATGGNTLPSKEVTYNSAYNELPTPTKTGYTFNGWYAESTFENAIDASSVYDKTDNSSIYAKWTANNDTPYKVEHYKQKLDGTYGLSDSENKTGTTDTTVNATAKSYTGYTYDKNVTGTKASGNVSGDGSLVLKLYYPQNTYEVSFDANGGTGSMSNESFKYEEEKPLDANTFDRVGYTFIGWSTTQTGGVEYLDEASVKQLTSTNGEVVKLYAVYSKNPVKPIDESIELEVDISGNIPSGFVCKVEIVGVSVDGDKSQKPPLPTDTIISISPNTTGSFDSIIFTKPGEYVYKVEQITTKDNGVTYDSSVYYVTIKVDEIAGELVSTTTISKDGNEVDKIVFNNKYSAKKNTIDKSKPVNTGDQSNLLGLLLMAMASLIIMTKRKATK